MFFNLFRRKKVVRGMISDAAAIREHLDWTQDHRIPLRIAGEEGTELCTAFLCAINHSQREGLLRIRVMNRLAADPGLTEGRELLVRYNSARGILYEFQTRLLKKGETGEGEYRLSYPLIVESCQDIKMARYKNSADEPIQVDVDKERGVVIDIGLKGLRFTSNKVFKTGTLLQNLQVELPRYGRVEGKAVVKYTQPASDYPLWRYLCGVEFTELKPKDHRRLNRYVNRMVQVTRV
ncbi:MAG: PilZ domain-containing protein [Deltaproteobacteria bacterium]|nr:PilZ domain-containing protein [Deltaproteobacteria bacterium]